MKHIMQHIKPGSRWTTTDKKFLVTGTSVTDDGTWIFYENAVTGQQYSCLADAFLNRFTIDLTGN